MTRLAKSLAVTLAAVLATAALTVAPAGADFGLEDFDVAFLNEDGSPAVEAGAHPFALTTSFGLSHTGEGPEAIADGKLRDFVLRAASGFTADTTSVPVCNTVDFLSDSCSLASVVGIQSASIRNIGFFNDPGPIYNLQPPPGAALRLGWQVENVPIVIDAGIEEAPSYAEMLSGASAYNAYAATHNVNQTVSVFASLAELWGVPADPAHDPLRGDCALSGEVVEEKRVIAPAGGPTCPTSGAPKPFLTLPRACEGPLESSYQARSWEGEVDTGSVLTHDDAVPPNPIGFIGCDGLGFSPEIGSQPTTDSAETGTGLDFSIEFSDEGLTSVGGRAGSEMKKTVVTLPEGVTVNPSVAEGLGVCTPADLDREALLSEPGEGCPNSSKIGTVSTRSPLLDEEVTGSVFIAQQDDPATAQHGAENPFDSLIAFYIVLRNTQNGILVKQPAKVEPDPVTGQLVTTAENIPQIPISSFDFHFREGQRAPLISPPGCGTYTAATEFTPWARPGEVVTRTADFQITRGVAGAPCPPGGTPPFAPEFEAGSINNSAKAYSPFYLRLVRHDGEQDMTRFSSVLPPGVVGKLAGVSKCPDAQIEPAKTRSGRQELASPSCPANSKIGRTTAGAGVGSALTYVPGTLYLAGPYKGAPLSVVAVTPAVAGPFDAGTVVVRVALKLDPETAEVEADGAASDPIPHILKGIPLKVRDLRVYVDRPEFTINPTSCDPSSARATLFGSYLDLLSPVDDRPVSLSTRYQAAGCLNLGFKPSLSLRLKGGTRRGDHPALQAVMRARPKDANLKSAVVTLPRSAFLDQAHIRTICTRVQFAAGAGNGEQCPKGARYGFVKAFTPLLDEPLQGPVYLRSSNHKLPDLVAALEGIVDVNVVARIDSHKGGIRTNFESIPDAPVSRVVLTMQGGDKGLIVNSRNLCASESRATTSLGAQNGRARDFRPPVRPSCAKKPARKSYRRG